jgi:alkanesulfonate monooxygenase SsuD/methylene tetrahydromethanopterin reductase-like flavin-dependent oxidoreductase (luciferase family)
VLGLAPGGRPDDYAASGVDFHRRGRIFEAQLEELQRLWAGEGGVGPRPLSGVRPGLLVGGASDVAYRRAARFADGWTMGGGPPDRMPEARAKLEDEWAAAGRPGEPRLVALMYFSLGERAEEVARANLGHYYAWLGDNASYIAEGAAKDDDTVRRYLAGFEEAGTDEVICFPASADPAQVELLARAIA